MRTYRIDRSYDWNYEHGPSFAGPWPEVPATPAKTFLGREVASRLGISAGLLLNARWIEVYARLGFDILTYKTVRSRHRPCYPLPNWVYLEGAPDPRRAEQVLATRPQAGDISRLTSSVSFGMPSKEPAVWMADVGRALAAIGPRQTLVVSVVATPAADGGRRAIIEDFARLAAMAREAGAHAIEANLSCPNVTTAEGQIFQDPEFSSEIARAMRVEARDVPVLLKGGYFPADGSLDAFLRAVAGQVEGVTLVNGMSRRITDPEGRPAYGPGREVAGVLGRGIFEHCLDVVRRAVAAIRRDRLDLKVVAVGGVYGEEQAAAYFEAGADAVTMGSAPMFDPLIAVRLKTAHPEW